MIKIKLALALLRRKELQQKVEILKKLKDSDIFYQIHAHRVKVSEGLDELSAKYPKLDVSQVTKEYDHYARQLRLIDAAIQQANWSFDIDAENTILDDYKA